MAVGSEAIELSPSSPLPPVALRLSNGMSPRAVGLRFLHDVDSAADRRVVTSSRTAKFTESGNNAPALFRGKYYRLLCAEGLHRINSCGPTSRRIGRASSPRTSSKVTLAIVPGSCALTPYRKVLRSLLNRDANVSPRTEPDRIIQPAWRKIIHITSHRCAPSAKRRATPPPPIVLSRVHNHVVFLLTSSGETLR